MILVVEQLIKVGLNILVHLYQILAMIKIQLLFDTKPTTDFI